MYQTLSSKSEDKECHQLLDLSTNKRGEAREEKKNQKTKQSSTKQTRSLFSKFKLKIPMELIRVDVNLQVTALAC